MTRKGCDNFSYQKTTTCLLVLFSMMVVATCTVLWYLHLVQCQMTSLTVVRYMWFWSPLKISITCCLASATWSERWDYVPSYIVNKWAYYFIYKSTGMCSRYYYVVKNLWEEELSLVWRSGKRVRKSKFQLQLFFPALGK